MEKQIPNILVFGSIGIDTINTPYGSAKNILGGSAIYASLAASYLSYPTLLATCGSDIKKSSLDQLKKSGVNLSNLIIAGKTFRWHGKYDLSGHVETLSTQFDNITDLQPKIPSYPPKFVLLANHDPEIQLKILKRLPKNAFTIADTIEFWINSKRDMVKKVFSKVNAISITDTEAKMLAGTPNTILAGKFILAMGKAQFVVIKKGEHGALIFFPSTDSTGSPHASSGQAGEISSIPAYPLELVKDPTGAGDSLAGGLISYLAYYGKVDRQTIKNAVVYGSMIASFVAENLGTSYRSETTRQAIEERVKFVRAMSLN